MLLTRKSAVKYGAVQHRAEHGQDTKTKKGEVNYGEFSSLTQEPNILGNDRSPFDRAEMGSYTERINLTVSVGASVCLYVIIG